jgi:hypothetical protein
MNGAYLGLWLSGTAKQKKDFVLHLVEKRTGKSFYSYEDYLFWVRQSTKSIRRQK